MKMEAARSAETSASYHITAWYLNPEDGELKVLEVGTPYNIIRINLLPPVSSSETSV